MHKLSFKRRLEVVEDALYKLNFEYGNILNDGLEDKVDQLQNLLKKQRDEQG